ncbi:MAG: hypothetical protein WA783_22135 [Phormidesmis sp.]
MSQTVTVKCPQCQCVYIAWHVPAVGTQASGKADGTGYQSSTACSKCGQRSILADLTEKDGIFQQVA